MAGLWSRPPVSLIAVGQRRRTPAGGVVWIGNLHSAKRAVQCPWRLEPLGVFAAVFLGRVRKTN